MTTRRKVERLGFFFLRSSVNRELPSISDSHEMILSVQNLSTATTSIASMINLSETGMCVQTELNVLSGDLVEINLTIDSKNLNIKATTKWCWSIDNNNNSIVGLEFLTDKSKFLPTLLSLIDSVPLNDRRANEAAPAKEAIVRIPHNDRKDYNPEFINERRNWLSKISGTRLHHLAQNSINPEDIKGNIENYIGAGQVPVGIVGPLKINGGHAKGVFYVPLATTEGALITTYQRGAIALTKAGGVNARVTRDENYLDPIFIFKNLEEAFRFTLWVKSHYATLKDKVRSATHHGKLLAITPVIIGRRVVLKISYHTEDAMGANMINFATESICKYISKHVPIQRYLLRSNLSSEKKSAGINLFANYGKEVYVEARIPKRIVRLYLHSSAREIARAWHSWALSSIQAGMIGINAQIANGLSGIFIACGQDVAHITNASVGINMLEELDGGDLYASLKLPNIIVGTVGGGTALGTQRECLEVMDCYGAGKAKKLAEIIGATLLAGELGICSGITSEQFLSPHIKASRFTKAKAYLDSTEKKVARSPNA